MAGSGSTHSHPTVALQKGQWHQRDTTMPQIELRDPFTQIAQFLHDQGFSKTLAALKAESEEKNIALNLDLWQQLVQANEGNSPVDLLEMWSHLFASHLLPSLGQEENRQRGSQFAKDRPEASSSEEEQVGGALLDVEVEETSDDGSDEDSDSSSDSPVHAGLKRKRILTPSSSEASSSGSDSSSDSGDEMKDAASNGSSSDSDSDSESSDDDRPLLKRTKLSKATDEEAKFEPPRDSEDHIDLRELHKRKKLAKSLNARDSSSSDSESDSSSASSSASSKSAKSKSSGISSSSSDSDSSSGSSTSSSGSSSSSSSDSDSSSDSSSSDDSSSSSDSDSDSGSSSSSSSASPKKSKKLKKIKTKAKAGKASSSSDDSTSSATLVGDADMKPKKEVKKEIKKEMDTLLVPDESTAIGTKAISATKENVKQLKKDQVPFSRIPTDQKIDPKFSSNKYISYDYADRAYQDLVVTKGKGFTKEKNKKKRGAYRGGAIDLAPKAIKFDD